MSVQNMAILSMTSTVTHAMWIPMKRNPKTRNAQGICCGINSLAGLLAKRLQCIQLLSALQLLAIGQGKSSLKANEAPVLRTVQGSHAGTPVCFTGNLSKGLYCYRRPSHVLNLNRIHKLWASLWVLPYGVSGLLGSSAPSVDIDIDHIWLMGFRYRSPSPSISPYPRFLFVGGLLPSPANVAPIVTLEETHPGPGHISTRTGLQKRVPQCKAGLLHNTTNTQQVE